MSKLWSIAELRKVNRVWNCCNYPECPSVSHFLIDTLLFLCALLAEPVVCKGYRETSLLDLVIEKHFAWLTLINLWLWKALGNPYVALANSSHPNLAGNFICNSHAQPSGWCEWLHKTLFDANGFQLPSSWQGGRLSAFACHRYGWQCGAGNGKHSH